MNVILGAGAAGVGAYAADYNCEIYEQDSAPGGLCKGFNVGDFYFDSAVHLSFSKIPEVRNIFDKVNQSYYKPRPLSWLKEQWLRHPAQNNLYPLSAEEKIEAVKSFIDKQVVLPEDNFETWNKNRYGKYMWDNLFYPYNKKYWCVPLDELAIDWIGNRIYQPSLDEVLFGCFTDETPNTYYASEMRYPKNGGYIAFFEELINKAKANDKLHLQKRAVNIDINNKTVEFNDGEIVHYDNLYASIPLPNMVGMISDAPVNLKDKAKGLINTGIAIVSIGINKVIDRDKLWFYIYDEDILAARAHYPSSKSENNVPEGCSSIQFEIYFDCNSNPIDKEAAIENCLYALNKMDIAQEQDIIFTDYRILPYANVVSMKNTKEDVDEIISWLEERNVYPIGRFGRWEYLWSDQAFMSGYNIAKKK